MKKFLTTFVTVMATIFTVFFTTNIPSANANTLYPGSSVWTYQKNENLITFYDFNNSGEVNILDLAYAKNNILNKGTISIYDLVNLQCYLNRGELLFPIKFYEWDIAKSNMETDAIVQEATTGFLTEWKYEEHTLRLRFLKNGIVTELRFSKFDSETEKNVIATINDLCAICKSSNGTYYIDSEFVLNNYTCHGWTKSEAWSDFTDEEILLVKENEDSIAFYVDDYRAIAEYQMKKTTNPVYFIRPVFYETTEGRQVFFLCKEDYDGYTCVFTGNYTVVDLNNLDASEFISNTDEENTNISLELTEGKFINYRTVGYTAIYLLKEDKSLTVLEISPKRYNEAKYTVKQWNNGWNYVLGITENNEFVWTYNSAFPIGD